MHNNDLMEEPENISCTVKIRIPNINGVGFADDISVMSLFFIHITTLN